MFATESIDDLSEQSDSMISHLFERNVELNKRLKEVHEQFKKYKDYSIDDLMTAGFVYMNDKNVIKCTQCGLEVKENIEGKDLYQYHYEHNVNCSFVRSTEVKKRSTQDDRKQAAKRLRTEFGWTTHASKNTFVESKIFQAARIRSFSHWSKNVRPTKEQMMAAGFFQCNVGDRIICIYCNLIAQQWNYDDDPSVVHSTLSPNCCFVRAVLNFDESSSVVIVNESFITNNATNTNNNPLTSDQIVYTSAVHQNYATVPSREATFEGWDTDLLPSVNDLVQAGFFYANKTTITTCFYCGGSLQNWGKQDKPLIEHIRWFPYCKYAKQLAGDELHERVQEIKRTRAEREATAAQAENNIVNHQLQIVGIDDRILSRLVAARLDLPSSQRLLDKPFKLSVIKRCWEDQLRLKHDDFANDSDLYIACLILQKQIEFINGNKDNIVIPSIKMQQIRNGIPTEKKQSNESTVISNEEPMVVENTVQQKKTETQIALNNPCIVCSKEEKRLACIPCGHLAVCSNCSQTVKTCPVCCRRIEAFVRVFI